MSADSKDLGILKQDAGRCQTIKLCPCGLRPKIAGGYCVECKRERQKAWRKQHPEIAYRNAPRLGSPLSTRERQVIGLLVAGFGYEKSGKELGISTSSVSMHANRAMARVGVKSLFQLGMWAERNFTSGFLPDEQCDCGPGCDGRRCAEGGAR